jgi:hypothetical protein
VRDTPQTASGAVLVAVLALIVDMGLAIVQRSVVSRGLTGRYGKVQQVGADTGEASASALQQSVQDPTRP